MIGEVAVAGLNDHLICIVTAGVAGLLEIRRFGERKHAGLRIDDEEGGEAEGEAEAAPASRGRGGGDPEEDDDFAPSGESDEEFSSSDSGEEFEASGSEEDSDDEEDGTSYLVHFSPALSLSVRVTSGWLRRS